MDRDVSSLQTDDATLAAALNKVGEAEARTDSLRVNVKDTSLKAPGRKVWARTSTRLSVEAYSQKHSGLLIY